MEKICEFEINNKIYSIYDVDKIEGKISYTGKTEYDTRKVFIEKTDYNKMLIILKHELMHIWLYENGYTIQNDEKVFNYEDVCELVALSNDSINNITNLYVISKEY